MKESKQMKKKLSMYACAVCMYIVISEIVKSL